MSRKSSKNRAAATGADVNSHLHAVADDPGQQGEQTTEDEVRTALTATPGSTTAALAMAAGVGRSTAAKILARWGRDGTAVRAAGDGPRNPDTWTLATSGRDPAEPDTVAPGTEDARPEATLAPSTDDPAGTEDAVPDIDDTPAEAGPAGPQAATGPDAASEPDGAAPSSDSVSETDDIAPLPDTAPTDPADSATDNGIEPPPEEPPAATDADTGSPDKNRLPKGGLRALVEEYLTDHPGETFGPAQIGKDLNRSGGAVNNALEKLVADGYAIKTCEAPKRFAINPGKTDIPETPDNTSGSAQEA